MIRTILPNVKNTYIKTKVDKRKKTEGPNGLYDLLDNLALCTKEQNFNPTHP